MTESEREHYSERAAILEYDAHLPRHEAEAQAMKAVERERNEAINRFLWGGE